MVRPSSGRTIADVFDGPLPTDGAVRVLARWAEKVEGYSTVVYVGAPINTGPALLAAIRRDMARPLEEGGLADGTDSVARQAQVVASNLRGFRALLRSVTAAFPEALLIDPTELDVPGWEQRDYYRMCVELVRRHATMAVFKNAWQFSIGCQVEVVAALLYGIPVLDQHMRTVSPLSAVAAITEAAREHSSVGSRSALTEDCLSVLRELCQQRAGE